MEGKSEGRSPISLLTTDVETSDKILALYPVIQKKYTISQSCSAYFKNVTYNQYNSSHQQKNYINIFTDTEKTFYYIQYLFMIKKNLSKLEQKETFFT